MAGTWTALVPIKPAGARKTRLAGRLTPAERDRLSEAMFRHVLGVLQRVTLVGRTAVLCAGDGPGGAVLHIRDEGRGLNAELEAARALCGGRHVVVLHADLPFVIEAEIAALLRGAGADGAALSPDRHGAGTNAIALAGAGAFGFAFGEASLARHLARPGTRMIRRRGLALDVDTPADLELALAAGLRF